MVPNYGESDILTLPEQIIPICERLASLGVTSVVNKLLFWGKLHEVKFHSLGLISASLQLKELIDSICLPSCNQSNMGTKAELSCWTSEPAGMVYVCISGRKGRAGVGR